MTSGKRVRRSGRRAGATLLLGALTLLASCQNQKPRQPEPIVHTEPAPPYDQTAARYNERVARLDQLWARAVVRLQYTDENAKEHEEQGEGLLQVIRPERMALSLKKAGKTLFWFGGDDTRYWLFDVVDKPVVRVGRHENIGRHEGAEQGLGLDIKPLEMIRLLGITPLPATTGTTAWSKNGRTVEVTTLVPGARGEMGATQVLSLDPASLLPQKIALLDGAGKLVVQADLEEYAPVDIANYGGVRPQMAGKIIAQHPASKTQMKVDLSDMKNSGVSEKAFQFEELCKLLGVDRMIDLDAPPPVSGAAQGDTATPGDPSK